MAAHVQNTGTRGVERGGGQNSIQQSAAVVIGIVVVVAMGAGASAASMSVEERRKMYEVSDLCAGHGISTS